jgi:hypothetical protein
VTPSSHEHLNHPHNDTPDGHSALQLVDHSDRETAICAAAQAQLTDVKPARCALSAASPAAQVAWSPGRLVAAM